MANTDLELTAMGAIATQLDGLDVGAQQRVLAWIESKYNSTSIAGRSQRSRGAKTHGPEVATDYADLASFFNAAAPKTENEKVLVAGYWFQKLQGASTLESAPLNVALTDLGHGISNIARTFDRLKSEKPTLAIQIQKSGKTKQARKQYKITNEGIRFVEQLLRRVLTANTDEGEE